MSEHDYKESFKLPLTPETFIDILETRVYDVSYPPINIQGLLYPARDLQSGKIVGDISGRPKYKISIKWGDTPKEQQKTLVHEVVHIAWGDFYIREDETIRIVNEELVEAEAGRFYEEHHSLVRLYHRKFKQRDWRRYRSFFATL